MKTLRFVIVIVAFLVIALLVSHSLVAQSTNSASGGGPLEDYTKLILSLHNRGDTNTATQVASLVSTMHRQRDATEVVMTVVLLERLRSGRTNETIRLLETRLDGALLSFDTPSVSGHDSQYDKILVRAREYRSKYPQKSGNPEIDGSVARALDSLPK